MDGFISSTRQCANDAGALDQATKRCLNLDAQGRGLMLAQHLARSREQQLNAFVTKARLWTGEGAVRQRWRRRQPQFHMLQVSDSMG